jgi:membrane associated rhomboid family serine protease
VTSYRIVTRLLITYQGWSYDIVGCNYDRVVIYKETWRWIASTLSHVSFLHLVLNMYSLWNMRWMEQAFTSFVYFMWSILIAFLSTFVTLCIYYLQLLFFQREQVRYIYMVGYSAVLFGLLVIASQHMKVSNVVLFGIFEIPPSWLPFVSMGLVTLLVPEASVVGHSSGIFLGFLIDWNDDYLVQSPWCWIWLLGIATITTIAFAFRTTPTFISF